MTQSSRAEAQAIADAARTYLDDHAGFEPLRRAIDSGARIDRGLWQGFARDMGFAGLGIAEAHGGSGLGPMELALVSEELGRCLAPIPFFESAILAAGLIDAVGDDDARARLLPRIASGESIATLAARDSHGAPLPEAVGPVLAAGRLTGAAHFVPFGDSADLLLVLAREATGLALLAVPAGAAGVRIEPLVTLDLTRPMAHVHFDLAIDADALIGTGPAVTQGFWQAWSRAGIFLAAEQLGLADRSLAETLSYARERVQFGRVIGSFQAMKHRMADMKLHIDEARSAVEWAVETLARGEDPMLAAHGARVRSTEAALHCAADAIQLHGGIGFTWEHHAHLFLKRARSAATLLDPPNHYRERIARVLLDGQSLEISE